MGWTMENKMAPILLGAFASAFGDDGKRLRDVPQENQAIGEALGNVSDVVDWESLPAATVETVFNSFRKFRNRVTVFHFAGHANGYELFLESSRVSIAVEK